MEYAMLLLLDTPSLPAGQAYGGSVLCKLATSSDASASPLDRAFAVAICRVLLPDFVCFGFQLPLWCARAIGATHNVSCEPLGVALPRRRCAAREGAQCRAAGHIT